MNKNKGVSLITLIIVIVVIIILVAITARNGITDLKKQAATTKTVYEVSALIDAVTNRALLNRLNPSYYTFVGNNDFSPIIVGNYDSQETYSGGGDWYYVSDKADFKELGLENVEGEFLVNYKSGIVISINPVEYEGEVFYSYNDLKRRMGGGTVMLSNVEYDNDKRVNKPVLSSGMVPVKLSGGKWVVASSDDSDWYDYSADQMAWANVMLKDELEVEGYSNEEIRNRPITDFIGKEVTNEGSSYVWIPRYTASSFGETGSKIIFSNLTNDTYSADGETYSLPQSFKYEENGETIDLPGIWVSKYEASFDR